MSLFLVMSVFFTVIISPPMLALTQSSGEITVRFENVSDKNIAVVVLFPKATSTSKYGLVAGIVPPHSLQVEIKVPGGPFIDPNTFTSVQPMYWIGKAEDYIKYLLNLNGDQVYSWFRGPTNTFHLMPYPKANADGFTGYLSSADGCLYYLSHRYPQAGESGTLPSVTSPSFDEYYSLPPGITITNQSTSTAYLSFPNGPTKSGNIGVPPNTKLKNYRSVVCTNESCQHSTSEITLPSSNLVRSVVGYQRYTDDINQPSNYTGWWQSQPGRFYYGWYHYVNGERISSVRDSNNDWVPPEVVAPYETQISIRHKGFRTVIKAEMNKIVWAISEYGVYYQLATTCGYLNNPTPSNVSNNSFTELPIPSPSTPIK